MSAESWAAAYRSFRAQYDNETDVARAVVRERITRAIEAHKEADLVSRR